MSGQEPLGEVENDLPVGVVQENSVVEWWVTSVPNQACCLFGTLTYRAASLVSKVCGSNRDAWLRARCIQTISMLRSHGHTWQNSYA